MFCRLSPGPACFDEFEVVLASSSDSSPLFLQACAAIVPVPSCVAREKNGLDRWPLSSPRMGLNRTLFESDLGGGVIKAD